MDRKRLDLDLVDYKIMWIRGRFECSVACSSVSSQLLFTDFRSSRRDLDILIYLDLNLV